MISMSPFRDISKSVSLTAELIPAEVQVLQILRFPDLRGYGSCGMRACVGKRSLSSRKSSVYLKRKYIKKSAVCLAIIYIFHMPYAAFIFHFQNENNPTTYTARIKQYMNVQHMCEKFESLQSEKGVHVDWKSTRRVSIKAEKVRTSSG